MTLELVHPDDPAYDDDSLPETAVECPLCAPAHANREREGHTFDPACPLCGGDRYVTKEDLRAYRRRTERPGH